MSKNLQIALLSFKLQILQKYKNRIIKLKYAIRDTNKHKLGGILCNNYVNIKYPQTYILLVLEQNK